MCSTGVNKVQRGTGATPRWCEYHGAPFLDKPDLDGDQSDIPSSYHSIAIALPVSACPDGAGAGMLFLFAMYEPKPL